MCTYFEKAELLFKQYVPNKEEEQSVKIMVGAKHTSTLFGFLSILHSRFALWNNENEWNEINAMFE